MQQQFVIPECFYRGSKKMLIKTGFSLRIIAGMTLSRGLPVVLCLES
jgi:hypothetical protein